MEQFHKINFGPTAENTVQYLSGIIFTIPVPVQCTVVSS